MREQESMTRRSFLGTSARGATALSTVAVAAPAVLGARSPNATIGVGHVGIGVRGGTLVEQVAGTDKQRRSAKYAPQIAAKEVTAGEPLLSFDRAAAPEQPSHMQDFFHCVRSRSKPRCNEDEAFIETATFMMSVVACREKREVRWDREREAIV